MSAGTGGRGRGISADGQGEIDSGERRAVVGGHRTVVPHRAQDHVPGRGVGPETVGIQGPQFTVGNSGEQELHRAAFVPRPHTRGQHPHSPGHATLGDIGAGERGAPVPAAQQLQVAWIGIREVGEEPRQHHQQIPVGQEGHVGHRRLPGQEANGPIQRLQCLRVSCLLVLTREVGLLAAGDVELLVDIPRHVVAAPGEEDPQDRVVVDPSPVESGLHVLLQGGQRGEGRRLPLVRSVQTPKSLCPG